MPPNALEVNKVIGPSRHKYTNTRIIMWCFYVGMHKHAPHEEIVTSFRFAFV